MKEDILHFIWQHQYFKPSDLLSSENLPLKILKQGYKNTNEGPDFEQAQIQIGEITWNGSVEIHVKSSDWKLHKHQNHALYENVILHVVWDYDEPIYYASTKEKIHTLELKKYVSNELIQKCEKLLSASFAIPCSGQIAWVDEMTKLSMFNRAAIERLERKSGLVLQYLNKYTNDWEQTTYSLTVQNFGFKVNAAPFARLAEILPYKIIQKHTQSIFQIEALLFGVAGFLSGEVFDDYYSKLKHEFDFLANKYGLQNQVMSVKEWKFMRMRPANFPTVRLSQLAALLFDKSNLFSFFIENEEIVIRKAFSNKVSPYWQEHYHFDRISERKFVKMGESSINILLINTVSILLAAYSVYQENDMFMEKALMILENCPAESNRIIAEWQKLGIKPINAFESQALIELFNEFCFIKKCLSCQIGNQILKI